MLLSLDSFSHRCYRLSDI